MPRPMSPAFLEHISKVATTHILLFYGMFENGPVRLHNGASMQPIIFQNEEWLGFGSILGMDGVLETLKYQNQTCTLSLNGLNPAIQALVLTEEFTHNLAIIHSAFLDEYGQLAGDPSPIFEGLMDRMTVQDNPDGQTASITLEITTEFSRFEQKNGRHTNHQEHTKTYPNDNFFVNVNVDASRPQPEW